MSLGSRYRFKTMGKAALAPLTLLALLACVGCEPSRPTFTCSEARLRLRAARPGEAVCLRIEPSEMVATESTLTFCDWGFTLIAPPLRDEVRMAAMRGGQLCLSDLGYLTDSTWLMAVIVSAKPR
jgi:hypothetical protein